MPIYEFKCSKCNNIFESLLIKQDDETELKCVSCGSEEFERVMSSTSYSIGAKSGEISNVKSSSRTCGGGNCTSWDIPGQSR